MGIGHKCKNPPPAVRWIRAGIERQAHMLTCPLYSHNTHALAYSHNSHALAYSHTHTHSNTYGKDSNFLVILGCLINNDKLPLAFVLLSSSGFFECLRQMRSKDLRCWSHAHTNTHTHTDTHTHTHTHTHRPEKIEMSFNLSTYQAHMKKTEPSGKEFVCGGGVSVGVGVNVGVGVGVGVGDRKRVV